MQLTQYVKTNIEERFVIRPVSGFLSLLCLLVSLGFSGASMAQDGLPEPEAEPAVTSATVNINTADVQTLADVLEGIGEVRAQAIVMHREENGNFVSLDDLLQIRGIGENTIRQNSERIRFE